MRAAGLITWAAAALACGCGRSDGRGDAGPPADAHTDAPPGTGLVSFGEAPGVSVMGVTMDAFLDGASIGNNFGGSRYVSVMGTPAHVGLIRFELTGLSYAVFVEAASLHLTTELPSTAGTVEVYALLENWQESDKDGSTGDCSWTNRALGSAWAVAGAGAPGSRSTVLLASFTPTTAGPLEIAFTGDALDLVQSWVSYPVMNHGVALVGDAALTEWTFASSESFTMDARPVLELAIR